MPSPTPSSGAAPITDLVIDVVSSLVGPHEQRDVLLDLAERCRALVGADVVAVLLRADADGFRLEMCTDPDPAVVGAIEDAAQTPETPVAQGFSDELGAPLAVGGDDFGRLVCLRRSGRFEPGVAYAVTVLARVAGVVWVFEQEQEDRRSVTEQLQQALDSRVVIEQAKGVVAAREQIAIEDAFLRIRSYTRDRGYLLHDVAGRIVRTTESPFPEDDDLPGARS